ncbi:MAG TPA: Gfo/Idh/MocA family oxidoreductase [Cyclobacteriaceae bacterium]|nr:Gfo/Idh/MocA family oxidoreductase [Cyclobacteriaceae bacterium]
MAYKFLNDTVRWGIIGCGDVCEVKSGPAFNKVPNSKLVAVMRRDAEKVKDYAVRHGVPKFYTDADQLINDDEINAIYIATPPASHETYALQAMKAGKPVYIEKPLTTNSASCERMIAAEKKYELPAVCAHYRRALPLYLKVRSLVNEGAIGNVRLIDLRLYQSPTVNIIAKTDVNWRVNPELSGGGLFHDLAPHQLDILYWLFGEPVSYHGRSLNQSAAYHAPDVTSLEVLFGKDILMQGLWAFQVSSSAVEECCKIIGDKGHLSFSFFKNPVLEISTSTGTEHIEFQYPANIQQPMIEQAVRYLRGEGANPCSLEDALVTMKMMDSTL